MCGIYRELLEACQKEADSLVETEELLQYPEVQADKGYYLSVLSRYNRLQALRAKQGALLNALDSEKQAQALLVGATEEERFLVFEEIAQSRRVASAAAHQLAQLLGQQGICEKALCKIYVGSVEVAKIATAFCQLLKNALAKEGATISDEKFLCDKSGVLSEISFVANGVGVLEKLLLFSGTHRVYCEKGRSQIALAATPEKASLAEISPKDIKVDLFHSGGAGGQNINKVETAVRVTHLPTNTVVVCQDERSQLKNKRRALENLQKRLAEKSAAEEKARMEADFRAQLAPKNSPLSFDATAGAVTDLRTNFVDNTPFPMKEEEFCLYLKTLLAKAQV